MHKHSKYLWVLLLIVILYFIIKNLFKKTYFEALTANFNEDASDDEKANELALYFANGLKPPEKEEEELEPDAIGRIELEFKRPKSGKIPYGDAYDVYIDKRNQHLPPEKKNPTDVDGKGLMDLDMEYKKFSWGHDSTDFNNYILEKDKKRIFKITKLLNEMPNKPSDLYFKNIENPSSFNKTFNEKINAYKDDIVKNDLSKTTQTNKDFYNKSISIASDYINDYSNGRLYKGSPL